ncbi:MAG: efflux transporter outer membrane subunit [Acetobacteraceae bacterium]|nr:efflux transporter outer membrane subunit [Acetobacteraceae bacterium]
MKRRRAAAGTLLLLAAGCTVGPDFKRPGSPQIPRWQNGSAGDPRILTTDPDPRWWAAFRDPVLTELVETAIRQNLDVQQAVLRVLEARQGIVTARSAGLPGLNGSASYMRDQLGLKGILESRGIYTQLNTLADEAEASGLAGGALGGASSGSLADRVLGPVTQPINLYQGALSASWELDLFGRVRRSVEQARAQTQAQAEAANDALTSLESEVAQAYVQLRAAQALRASQEENIRSARASLDLTQSRQAKGLSTMLDVDQARTQLLTLERQLPEYVKQERQAIDRLDVLIGRPPGTLDARLLQPAPLPRLPTAVGVGVPSTLARRRPDIREAEAQLHAAVANVGVAVANFYPDVSLTGSLGIRATDASYITRWASHYYSAGPSLSLPIFQGGRLTANLRLARAQAVEAALRYRGTVLNALREVEDALVSFRADRIERDRLADVLRSAAQTLALATSRYAHGLSDYLQVLDSQRTVDDDRQQLVQQDMTLANDVVTLYRVLGGGWEAPGAGSEAPRVRGAPPITPAALDSIAAVPGVAR